MNFQEIIVKWPSYGGDDPKERAQETKQLQPGTSMNERRRSVVTSLCKIWLSNIALSEFQLGFILHYMQSFGMSHA
jgi:hypothetical protein